MGYSIPIKDKQQSFTHFKTQMKVYWSINLPVAAGTGLRSGGVQWRCCVVWRRSERWSCCGATMSGTGG